MARMLNLRDVLQLVNYALNRKIFWKVNGDLANERYVSSDYPRLLPIGCSGRGAEHAGYLHRS